MTSTNRIDILGCPIDNLSMAETLDAIDKMIETGKPHQHVVVNADKFMKLQHDKKLYDIITGCDLINADGMPLVWMSKLFNKTPLKERVAGIDLMEKLVEFSAEKGHKPYFLGAKEEIVSKVVKIYTNKYPKLKIAGYRNGYWKTQEDEDNVAEEIKNSKADILFVAFGSPKKEIFLNKYLNTMNVPFVMGVGGSFDVVAGFVKRAPVWMQKTGLEWFYRFLQEPKRMWKRYLVGNMKFILFVLSKLMQKIFDRIIGGSKKGRNTK